MRRLKFLCLLVVLLAFVMTAGCGKSNEVSENSAKSNGQNCIECHISKEKILADLKANPLKAAVKSSETSGEG